MRTLFAALILFPAALIAQPVEVQYNPNSIEPIARYEQLWKFRCWLRMDLQEKQNRGFFSNNGEITKLIIEAAKSGEIAEIYKSDSLVSTYQKSDWLNLLVQQQGQQFQAWDPTLTYYLNDVVNLNGKNYIAQVEPITGINPEQSPNQEWAPTSQGQALEYLPRDIYLLTVVEDRIFDKRRSRLYHDIQAIGLSAWDANTSTFKQLGWFKYKDLEKVFRDNPEKAYWFNRRNTAENKNFADAFKLRLFHGTLEKVENPEDETIFDQYRANNRPYKEAVWATEWEEMRLMELEHNLWEF